MSSSAIPCFGIAAGAALLVLGWTFRRGALRAGLWFAAAILGQAASLQLVHAGPAVGYQHYLDVAAIARQQPVSLVALVALGLAVAVAAARRWGAIREWVARYFSRGSAILLAGMAFLTSATLSRHASAYVAELIVASVVQLIILGAVTTAVVSLPEAVRARLLERMDRILERTGDATTAPWRDPTMLLLALGVVALSAALAFFSYERHPHVPDEVAYLLQAKYFARGMLVMPPPPVPGGFDLDLVQAGLSGWFSVFPPGWPVILAFGVLAGVPWLVNPLLGGLNVILAWILLRQMYQQRTARLAVALLAFSPWHLFLAMSFMSHTFSLTLVLIAAVGIASARRTGAVLPAVAAGLAIGLVGLTRPLEGVVVAVLLGIAAVGARGRRFRFAPAAAVGMGTAITGGLGLWYNHLLTGGFLRFPVEQYFARVYGAGHYEIGFGPTRGLGWAGLDPFPGHGALDVLVNANLNATVVNQELFGWGTGSLLLVGIGALLGWRLRPNRVMLAAIAGIVIAHSFYWFSGGPDFGARYWFLIIVPCVALAASGIERLAEISRGNAASRVRSGPGHLAAAGLSLMALVTFVPWRAVDKYHHYRGMRPDVRAIARDSRLKNAIVLVRGARHPDYASAAVYNTVGLEGTAPIFAWDRDVATTQALRSAFPDRSVWILNGPTVTGRGYELVDGPVPPRIP
jgi:hypothetical protein